MNFSIRTIIRDLVAPKHQLSISTRLWCEGTTQLHRRGRGHHESGAFLLGTRQGESRRITRFVYYDDLDPKSLETGIVIFDGIGYGPLWQICRETGLAVVADVHTHPGSPKQSIADRDHPMIAKPGHIALILPEFANRVFGASEIGIYRYKGDHKWQNLSGSKADKYFYIGRWG